MRAVEREDEGLVTRLSVIYVRECDRVSARCVWRWEESEMECGSGCRGIGDWNAVRVGERRAAGGEVVVAFLPLRTLLCAQQQAERLGAGVCLT